jgi:hypothetical protein
VPISCLCQLSWDKSTWPLPAISCRRTTEGRSETILSLPDESVTARMESAQPEWVAPVRIQQQLVPAFAVSCLPV